MLKLRQLERIIKGFANHRRIAMIELLQKQPELSLLEISIKLKINIKTASEHLLKLTNSDIVLKRNRANNVLHKLSHRGESILEFLRKQE